MANHFRLHRFHLFRSERKQKGQTKYKIRHQKETERICVHIIIYKDIKINNNAFVEASRAQTGAAARSAQSGARSAAAHGACARTQLKKVDFLKWKGDDTLRENEVLRRYHIQVRGGVGQRCVVTWQRAAHGGGRTGWTTWRTIGWWAAFGI